MVKTIDNVHERFIAGSPQSIRGWLDQAWSGTPYDIFPHDWLPTWREAGAHARFGHATMVFRLRSTEPLSWQADVLSSRFLGWHGFELIPAMGGTLVRHRLTGTLRRSMRWQWPALVRPLHDWAVEALLDRLQSAIATGKPPATTDRVMPVHARLAYDALDAVGGGTFSGRLRLPLNWGVPPTKSLSPCRVTGCCHAWISSGFAP